MLFNPNPNAVNRDPERRPLLKAVRAKCLDCSGGSPAEVRRCHLTKCPLWHYRMGTDPFAKPRGRVLPRRTSQNFSSLLAGNFGGAGPSES